MFYGMTLCQQFCNARADLNDSINHQQACDKEMKPTGQVQILVNRERDTDMRVSRCSSENTKHNERFVSLD